MNLLMVCSGQKKHWSGAKDWSGARDDETFNQVNWTVIFKTETVLFKNRLQYQSSSLIRKVLRLDFVLLWSTRVLVRPGAYEEDGRERKLTVDHFE